MIVTDFDFLWGHLISSGFFLIIGSYYFWIPPKKYQVEPKFNVPSKMTHLNKDTWKESFQYSGKIMVITSSIFLFTGLFFSYSISTNNFTTNKVLGLNLALMMITMMVLAIIGAIMTENHMEKTFDKKGKRLKKDN